jgi:hypothetical protein
MGACPTNGARNFTAWRTCAPVDRTRSSGTQSREFKSGTNTSALRRKWPRVIKRELVHIGREIGGRLLPAITYAGVRLPAHLNAGDDLTPKPTTPRDSYQIDRVRRRGDARYTC